MCAEEEGGGTGCSPAGTPRARSGDKDREDARGGERGGMRADERKLVAVTACCGVRTTRWRGQKVRGGASVATLGRVMVKVMPCPSILSTVTSPWWAATISRTIYKPNPVPPVAYPVAADNV